MHSASAAAPLLALACLWIGVVGSALGQLYCPQECSCYRSTVRCFGQNLVEVVRGIPPTTTILDLRFNHIRRLARDDFAHLPLLNTLLLSNNQLEEVEEGCFAKLPNLHTLYLDGNRLSRITEVVLHCQANGYPRPFVQWTLNHHPISLSHRVRFQRDGTLTIDKVDVKDVGTYTCIAHNSRSQATASARVEVRVAPTFVAHPQNTITSEGAELRLLCEAKGYPQPSITWLKDGRPVQISQRFTMSLSNTLSKAIIEIRHTSSPKITLAPSTVSASVGGTVSFPCKAVGEPKPRITWSFNGMAIPTVVGHYEVSSQNTLYVNLVTKADAGHYMCQATNDVGSVSADATLYVLDDVGERQSPAIVDRDFIHSAVRQATQNVDRAINFTQEQLYSDKPKTPAELMALFKYPGPQAIQFARARDIYDETLSLVQAHVVRGLRFNVSGSYKYDDILSPAHVLMISELSGCDVPRERPTCSDICFHSKFRTYDGTCNNLQDTTRGASLTALKRLLPPAYENGFDMPIGWNKDFLYHGFKKPNPRVVSMSVVASERITDDSQYSHMLMQWGQFIDHDLSFTVQSPSVSQYQGGVNCARTCTNRPPCFNIDIPRNDPRIHDGICIEFQRSSAICGSGTSSVIYNHIQQRQQVNQITAYIDASSVYGSHEADALDLRDLFSDHGLMKFDITSHKQKPYLPFNRRFPMDCHRNTTLRHSVRCMMGGDYRANEQVGLLTMHTLFLREHNRIASELLKINPHWNGERLYQETRKIIGAEFQHITYAHWLPKILGMRLLGDYNGYDPNADSGVYNEFATAAFRFGHSLIQPFITRLNASFMPHENGPLPLREAFFAPERMLEEGGLDPLRDLYGHPDNIDLWVGGLSEIPLPSARVGPVLACIIAKQFKETRAGDRFWYENPGVFNSLQLTEIRKASLARAICDNGDEIDRAQPDVFVYVGHNIDSYVKCETLPAINLNMWQECCSDSCAADSQKVEFVDEEEETAEQPKVR
ncbi:unnamed protein product [Soboliphyme baturini]|uniref:Peroxidase n=1 Tax=Soboliphyme baturini TaxID=241478 RepID=A0A183IS30_9BILA|nr:unnamed protein product [Soboliphyme baturini]